MLETYYENISKAINYGRSRVDTPEDYEFHLHNFFEIYFFISGDVNYFIEKKVYPLKYGDLLIINNHEIHKPTFRSRSPYERIVIHFEPEVVRLLSAPDFDLLNCFIHRPIGEQNKVALSPSQTEEILRLFYKIEHLENVKPAGWKVLKLTYFLEILVLVNRAFMNVPLEEDHTNIPEKLAPLLDYIDANLETDLSLEFLENNFYLNRFYLSRLFKKSTGSSIHEYILFKRISKAKKLLSEGHSVTETCMLSGFSDYSNFIRMFKKTTGISPGQYGKKYPSYSASEKGR